ncbi:MAG: FAD-binding protein, partial [Verrucomicrobiota bacterium]
MALAENIISQLRGIVGSENVLTAQEDLIPYSFDGTAALQQMPGCVLFTKTAVEISAVLKLANEKNVAIVTRGSGTGLSGGSMPSKDCVVLCTVKMDKIL